MQNVAVFDVDGTICFDGVSLDAEIVDALSSLMRQWRLVFASARPIRDLLPVLPPQFHQASLIGGNGAFCRADGTLEVLGIADQDRRLIDRLIDKHDLRVLIDGDWNYAYTGDAAHRIFRQLDAGRLAANVARHEIPQYSKVVLFTNDPAIVNRLRDAGLSVTVHPDEGIVDIAPSGITKHQALGRLGIPDRAYWAFGNDANDEPLLRHARASYCVGNHPALRFADHHLTRDAVAPAIRALVTRSEQPKRGVPHE
jgi:HAD superfamily hydrolase (TIGR01484 family)